MSWRGYLVFGVAISMPLLIWWSPAAYGLVFVGGAFLLGLLTPAIVIATVLRKFVDLRLTRLVAGLPLGALAYWALGEFLSWSYGAALRDDPPPRSGTAALLGMAATFSVVFFAEIFFRTPRRFNVPSP
jgi:hypothetical protein